VTGKDFDEVFPIWYLGHLHVTIAMLIYVSLWLYADAVSAMLFSETPSAFFRDYKADSGAASHSAQGFEVDHTIHMT
jgi:hypothetical protein